jgi:penicillin-binding protein 1A
MATRTTKHPPGTEPRENGHATEAPTNADGNGGSVLRPPGGKTTVKAPSRKKGGGRKLFARKPRSDKGAPVTKGSADTTTSEAPTAIVIPPPGAGNGSGDGNGNGGPPVIPAIPPAGKPPKPKVKKLRILFIALGLGVLGLCSAFFGMFMAVSQDLPAIEKYAQYKASKNSVVVDSQGEYIGTLSSNENRVLIPPEKISPNMKNAVVSIEDARFYEHRGVDYQGLGRALVQDIIARSAKQGASTITQQLIKQALEAQNDRSPLQKMREMALAYHIEQEWTKDKILTEYLNTVYFGSGAYGVEAAAKTYFGKAHPGCGTDESPCAEVLTPAEAALLAGIIQNPYGYDPAQNPDAALLRRNTVLQKMYEQGYITKEQFDESSAEALPPAKDIEPPSINSKAPYFTEWIRQQLVDRYGAGRAFFGGLKVKTSLDLEVQAAAENAVYSTIGGIGPDASVVIINNKDATVDAMVAGTDYKTAPFNLATQGYRQPGSTVKPFVLTTALSQGISPDSVWESAPQTFEFGKKKNIFEVKNYGDSYSGSLTLSQATTLSDNSVYAQVGLEGIKGGPRAIAETIQEMGVADRVHRNPAMVLGTSEVSPLQWTYAFSTLANDGRRVSGTLAPDPGDSPVAYTKVTDEDDKTIKGGDNQVISTGVIDPDVAVTAKGILHTVVTEGTGKNAYIGDDSQWGKTGTTTDNTNAWFCGAITEVTACVWVGYAQGYQQMTTEYGGSPVDGGTFPAIIWARVIEAWQGIEAARAADREAEAAAKAAGEDVPDDTSSDYVAPSTDYVAPTTVAPTTTAPTTPAPTPAPTTPAPTAPAPAPAPSTPAPSTGGSTPSTGGAAPG